MYPVRRRINESKLGKIVNESSIGQKFIKSPFAFATEEFAQTYKSTVGWSPLSIIDYPLLAATLIPADTWNVYHERAMFPNAYDFLVTRHLEELGFSVKPYCSES